jgi:predicted nucleic acid-binding protein
MILLDTNVISELMCPAIAPAVAAYLQAQDPETLFTAGTALARSATVATRNVADFSGCGIAVAHPWDGA